MSLVTAMKTATRLGLGAIALSGALATPAAAYDYVPTANGEVWGVQDAAAPRVDTGSIRDTTSSSLRGYGGLRVSVSTHPRFDGELLRGFGLRFDPPERFTPTQAVDLGGVAIAREVRFNRTQNWGRWLDTFQNTTDAPITVKASFGGQLGIGNASGSTNARIADSSSGDLTAGTDDAWVEYRTGTTGATGPVATATGPSATVSGPTPVLPGSLTRLGDFLRGTFSLPPADAGHESNFVGLETDFVLAPGQTRTLAHFVAIGTAESATGTGTTAPGAQVAAVRNVAAALAAESGTGTVGFSDLTKGQLCALVNWDPAKITNVAAFSAAADCPTAGAPPLPPVAATARTTTGSPYDVTAKTITQELADMAAGRTTSEQITRAYLDRIAAYDRGPAAFNAVPTIAADAMDQARAADAARAAGDTKPLLGIPLVAKDLYDTKDMTTTNGSLAFDGYRPRTDATLVKDLRDAGAIILGKAAMEEYALSGQYSDDYRGQVWNAFEPSKSSIASSGGTAVAIAASLAAGGLGTQTGDSLYGPASAASEWTLRGTDGLTSSHGVMPLSYLQDFAGSIARSPEDLALLLNAITGTDPLDETTVAADASARRPADWRSALRPDALQGKRIGYYASAFVDPFGTTGTVGAALAQLQRFQDAGATLVQIGGGPTLPANTAGGATDFHGWALWLKDHPDAGYDDPRQILASQKRLPYRRSLNGYTGRGDMSDADVATYKTYRANAKTAVASWLDSPPTPVVPGTTTASPGALDAVVFPGLRSDVSLNDGGSSAFGRGDPPTNSAGAPSVAFPAGLNDHGEPLDLQLVGRAFDDAKLLGYAYAFDQVAHGHVETAQAPPLTYEADAPPPTVPAQPPVVAPLPDPIPAEETAPRPLSTIGPALSARVTLTDSHRLATVRARGLGVRFTVPRAAVLKARLTVSAATAKRLGTGTVLGRGERGVLSATSATVKVRLTRRAAAALRSARRVTATLSTTATDAAGGTATATRTVVLKR